MYIYNYVVVFYVAFCRCYIRNHIQISSSACTRYKFSQKLLISIYNYKQSFLSATMYFLWIFSLYFVLQYTFMYIYYILYIDVLKSLLPLGCASPSHMTSRPEVSVCICMRAVLLPVLHSIGLPHYSGSPSNASAVNCRTWWRKSQFLTPTSCIHSQNRERDTLFCTLKLQSYGWLTENTFYIFDLFNFIVALLYNFRAMLQQ